MRTTSYVVIGLLSLIIKGRVHKGLLGLYNKGSLLLRVGDTDSFSET